MSLAARWQAGEQEAMATVCELHGADVLAFIKDLVPGERAIEVRDCLMLLRAATSPPPAAPAPDLIRATVLRQAFIAQVRTALYRPQTQPRLWGFGDPDRVALDALSAEQRCAVALVRRGTTRAERRAVLAADDADAFVDEAHRDFVDGRWAARMLLELRMSIDTKSTHNGLAGQSSRYQWVVELAEELISGGHSRQTLGDKLLRLVGAFVLGPSNNVELGEALDSRRAACWFQRIEQAAQQPWAGEETPTLGGPLVLLLHSYADEDAVDRLFRELREHYPRLWMDREHIAHGRGPIVLVLMTLMLVARRFVVTEGRGGLGPTQKLELACLDEISGPPPAFDRVCVTGLEGAAQQTRPSLQGLWLDMTEPSRAQRIGEIVDFIG